ncbi:bis(5'-nucleosyl)-tetraphosphatase [Planctomicrobium sp. SH664]|uniref:bis(5'-nucleosyl)-tetraphosphatase n=1 Tax=Planctomicrobium sp. SH664 TaxID=3448125 RepID=UPI003F5BC40B
MDDSVEVKSCGVLVVQGNPIHSFLLMKHPDRWDLPKGHVDPGESDLECALREMEEETGIPRSAVTVDPGFEFRVQYYVQTARENFVRKLKTLIIFLVSIPEPVKIRVTEHEGYRWFPWPPEKEIQARVIDPLLQQVQEYLQRSGSNMDPPQDAASV